MIKYKPGHKPIEARLSEHSCRWIWITV